MSQLAPTPVFRGVDAFGFPLYLGQLGTFVAGTNTPQVTYKDSLQVATNTNPIVLNPRGECNLWLDPTKSYKFVLSDALGNLIWTEDNITIGNANPSFNIIPTVDNLFTLGSPTFSFANLYLGANHAPVLDTVSGNIGYYARTAEEVAASITPSSFSYPPGNVLRYGADPTGAIDATAAFNQATFYTATYTSLPLTQPNQLQDIVVPPGTYLINGTVYVRKGQRLRGASNATYIVANSSGTAPTFQMGWGFIASVPTVDPGGQPVSISDLFILGGPSSGSNNGTIVFNAIAGGFVSNIFMSGPGIGLGFYGSGDILVSNVIIEIAQIAIAFNATGNTHFTNTEFFNNHFDVSFSGVCADIQFTGFHSEFNQTDSLLLSTGSTVFGLQIDNAKWIYNVQYGVVGSTPSPNPTILNQSTNSDIQIFNFRVNNSPGYFYSTGTGTGCVAKFSNGVIDGVKSFSSYAASTTALGFSIANERMTLNNVTFKNLPGNGIPCVLAGNATATILELRDCEWYNNNASFALVNITSGLTSSIFRALDCIGDKVQVLCNAQSTVQQIIRRCTDWFGAIGTSGASHFVTFPYQFSNAWQVAVTVNQNTGGSASYRKTTVINVEKDNDFSASAKSFLSATVLVQGAANTNGILNITPEFNAVGGGNNIASSNSGVICCSWPLANVGNETVDVQQIL
jgi:hypothetical protein